MLPSPNPAVIFQRVTDGAVLLNTEAEVYFGLNNVGAEIWQLLPPSCASFEALCATLARKYPEANAEEVARDAAALLEQLASEGLVLPPVDSGAG